MKNKYLKAALAGIILSISAMSHLANAGIIYHFEGEITEFNDYGFNVFDDLTGLTFSGKIEYEESFLNSGHIYGADLIGDVFVGEYSFSTPFDSAFIEGSSWGVSVYILPFNPVLILNSFYPTKRFVGDSVVAFGFNGYGSWSYNAYSPLDDSLQLSIRGEIKPVRDVPEPSTFAIFALGMIGLASRRFKKQ